MDFCSPRAPQIKLNTDVPPAFLILQPLSGNLDKNVEFFRKICFNINQPKNFSSMFVASMKSARLPIRLKKDPILEALFEIRFRKKNVPPPEILPGIFFTKGEDFFRLSLIERLMPVVPEEALQKDEVLRYFPQVRIKGEKFGIQIADSAVSLSYFPKYEGWSTFKGAILKLLEIMQEVQELVLDSVSRFSLKYINLFEGFSGLKPLKIGITIGEHQVSEEKSLLRIEIPEEENILILHVNTFTKISVGGKVREGLLLSIDVIKSVTSKVSGDIFPYIRESLEELHDLEKKWFFDVLREETLELLEPEYD